MPRCCSSGGAARSASCRSAAMAPGINPTDAELAAILPAQPRRLHHPRAAGDQICGDRPRAGRPDRGARPRPRSPPSTATAPPPTARARPARCSRSCCRRQAARRRPSRSACAAAPASSTPPARPASRAGDVTFADQSREPVRRRRPAPQVAAAAFARRAGRVAGPIRSRARLPRRPGRADHADRRRGRSRRCAARSPRAIEQRKRADALAALVSRIEDQLTDGASFEEVGARRRPHHRHHAADHRRRARPASGQAWAAPPELQPLLRAAFEIDAENPEPVVEPIPANARFALIGVDRVEPAAPPPLAQIRDQVRAALIRAARARPARAARRPRSSARINAGTPAARAFAEAQPRLPAAEPVDMRRLDISRGDQQVPPPLIALFRMPPGPRPGDGRAEQRRLVRSSSTSSARRANRRGDRGADPRPSSRVQRHARARSSPSNSPARSRRAPNVQRNDASDPRRAPARWRAACAPARSEGRSRRR